jgi:hypothetical protein
LPFALGGENRKAVTGITRMKKFKPNTGRLVRD